MTVMAPPMRIPAMRSHHQVRVFGTISPMLSEMTDLEVAHGFRSGQEDALAEAYRRWSRMVHATAMRSTGNAEDAATAAAPAAAPAAQDGQASPPAASTSTAPAAARGRSPRTVPCLMM